MGYFNRPLYAKDYRLAADKKCSKHSSILAIIYLIYFAIVIVMGGIVQLPIFQISAGSVVSGVELTASWGNILTLFVAGHFLVGLIAVSVKIYSDVTPDVNDLFHGFKNYGNILGVYLLQEVYIFLWSLLFGIPGLIKTYSYSMTLFIINDNPNKMINECITDSRKMMDGYKWKLFCLDLSYIGWYFLCALTLGILSLWVVPKHQYARYLFYLKVSGKGYADELRKEQKANEETIKEQPSDEVEPKKEYSSLEELDKKFEEIE